MACHYVLDNSGRYLEWLCGNKQPAVFEGKLAIDTVSEFAPSQASLLLASLVMMILLDASGDSPRPVLQAGLQPARKLPWQRPTLEGTTSHERDPAASQHAC
jgi:hypothetical protein